ncbi:PrpF domain-containing protein [Streptomyces sp. P9(2023)]|uniref:PrpF domain-containing protein n=1 Tax=Streptomyces sp. P9(2023) TaxID=3064394 RepID=UPI0028F45508|nr:PrpF domain-containing protein [Streptomyces sp. P9(2023)]MDT9693216.1 PrpF domain-containing protein [Streptomyces sp. P9(2023)]
MRAADPGRPRGASGGRRRTGLVPVSVVRAEDAPGPTLVVEVERLPYGAMAVGEELSALRAALEARTPYGHLDKIALYGPSARPDSDLDYRFVQALPGGGFDFRTGCGHSLLACVVAAARPGPVTVHAVTTGDLVRCTPEPSVKSPGGAHTLRFLRAPTAPGTLPTGRPLDVLRGGVPVSLVRYGNPYVFVDGRHLGVRTERALFRAGDDVRRALLGLRAHAARLLGHDDASALPKIAAFTHQQTGIAVRALTVGGWHPRLALTGAAALAAAGALPGTVVPDLAGRAVRTPGGRTVTVSAGAQHVAVRHKRATVLDRFELPWRIHATA